MFPIRIRRYLTETTVSSDFHEPLGKTLKVPDPAEIGVQPLALGGTTEESVQEAPRFGRKSPGGGPGSET